MKLQREDLKGYVLLTVLQGELELMGMKKSEVNRLTERLFEEAKGTTEPNEAYVIRKLEEKRDGLAKGNPK